MKNIKVIYSIFCYDLKNSTTCILSLDKDNIVLPYSIIEKPIFVQEQIKTYILGLFKDPTIKNLVDIDISILELYNSLIMDYILSSDKSIYNYDEENDLILSCSLILLDKNISHLSWIPVNFNPNLTDKKPIDFYIDDILKRIST